MDKLFGEVDNVEAREAEEYEETRDASAYSTSLKQRNMTEKDVKEHVEEVELDNMKTK